MKSRIGEIITILNNAKRRGAILKGNSVLEKELKAIMDGVPTDCPPSNPGIFNQDGTEQTPPTPYEQEFKFKKNVACWN